MNAKKLPELLDVDIVIIWNPGEWQRDPNFFYVTQLTEGLHEGSIAIVSEQGVKVLTSQLEEGLVRKAGLDAVVVSGPEDLKNKLKETAKNAKRIGYVGKVLPVSYYKLLGEIFNGIELVDVSQGLQKLRMIKSDEEIARIVKACDLITDVMRLVPEMLSEDISENEIAARIIYEITKRGGKPAFEPIVAFEENAADPHYFHGKRTLKKDEIVLVDIGANVSLYNSDITRTMVFGKWTPEKKDVFETVLQAQQEAIDAIQPGVHGSEIHKVAESIINKKYPGRFIHGLGHGLGIAVHDPGGLSPYRDIVLEPGMVLTVEPGIYLPRKFGIRIEDDILVTKSGAKVLTNIPKKLMGP